MSDEIQLNIALGIDFGSNHSRAAFYCWNGIHYATDGETGDWIPSYASYAKLTGINIEPVLVGKLAKYQWVRNLPNTIYDVKRIMGRTMDDPVMTDDQRNYSIVQLAPEAPPTIAVTVNERRVLHSPEEVASEIFRSFKIQLCRKLISESAIIRSLEGDNPKNVKIKVERGMIAVPPHFNNRRRNSVIEAGRMVFKEVRLVHDTTAAAYNLWKEDRLPEGQNHMIYNFGHSSVDCTIVRIEDGKLTVLAHGSEVEFGGRAITLYLMNHLKEVFKRRHQRDWVISPEGKMKMWLRCQKIKKQLSYYKSVRFYYSEIYLRTSEYKTIERLHIDDFLAANCSSVLDPVQIALNDAELTKEEISRVICIGNGSKTPKIKSMLEYFFNGRKLREGEVGKEIEVSQSESDVVRGVALIANQWEGNHDLIDRRLPAVYVGNNPSPVIPRNSLLGMNYHKKMTRGKYENETVLYEVDDTRDDGNKTPLMASVTPRGDFASIVYMLSIDQDGIVSEQLRV